MLEQVQPPVVETAGLYISQRPMAEVLNNVMGTGPTPFNFIQVSLATCISLGTKHRTLAVYLAFFNYTYASYRVDTFTFLTRHQKYLDLVFPFFLCVLSLITVCRFCYLLFYSGLWLEQVEVLVLYVTVKWTCSWTIMA